MSIANDVNEQHDFIKSGFDRSNIHYADIEARCNVIFSEAKQYLHAAPCVIASEISSYRFPSDPPLRLDSSLIYGYKHHNIERNSFELSIYDVCAKKYSKCVAATPRYCSTYSKFTQFA